MLIKFLPFLLMAAWAWFQFLRSQRHLRRNSTPLAEPELTAALGRFRNEMGAGGEIDVKVYNIPIINGLAAPDGGIYLTQGMVEGYRAGKFSAEELAGVIAHEIGHVALGHNERRQAAWRTEMAVRAALSVFLPRALGGMTGWLANMATRLLNAGLSQRDEYEADAFGAALMLRCGYSPEAQATLLEKLTAEAGTRGVQISWLASHPPTPKRAERLRAFAAQRKAV